MAYSCILSFSRKVTDAVSYNIMDQDISRTSTRSATSLSDIRVNNIPNFRAQPVVMELQLCAGQTYNQPSYPNCVQAAVCGSTAYDLVSVIYHLNTTSVEFVNNFTVNVELLVAGQIK